MFTKHPHPQQQQQIMMQKCHTQQEGAERDSPSIREYCT